MKLVLIQNFKDEFNLLTKNFSSLILVGHITKIGDENKLVNKRMQKVYSSEVGKMLHISRQTRPESLNTVSEVIRFINGTTSQ